MFHRIKNELNLYFGKIKGYGTYQQFVHKKLTAPLLMIFILLVGWGMLRPDAINSALLFGMIVLGVISVVIPLFSYVLFKIQLMWSRNRKND